VFRDRSLLVGVGHNQAGIHCKALSANQSSRNARPNNTLEDASEDAAIVEAIIARTRERRMVRYLVLNRQPASVSKC
jgi:hypothetical protein